MEENELQETRAKLEYLSGGVIVGMLGGGIALTCLWDPFAIIGPELTIAWGIAFVVIALIILKRKRPTPEGLAE